MIQNEDELLKIAELLQEDCHKLSNKILEKRPTLSYEDIVNIWMFTKMAEYELRLKKLENEKQL